MGAHASRKFPHPLDPVEFRAVGWEELQSEIAAVLSQPGLDELSMVPPGVVHHKNQTTESRAMAHESFQEVEESLGIEDLLLLSHQVAVFHPNCPEEAHVLPGGCVQHDWISFFRRDPRGAASPMLLEMTLVLKPHVAITACGQTMEFF
jgi:hypothetical protein